MDANKIRKLKEIAAKLGPEDRAYLLELALDMMNEPPIIEASVAPPGLPRKRIGRPPGAKTVNRKVPLPAVLAVPEGEKK